MVPAHWGNVSVESKMSSIIRSALKWVMSFGISVGLIAGGLIFWKWDAIQRRFFGGVTAIEYTQPALPARMSKPAILVFSKTNGVRHNETIAVANSVLEELARKKGWGFYQTERGGIFTPHNLARFDAIIFNNVTGDVLAPSQRDALKNFVRSGGGFVGLHASVGDDSLNWPWYTNELIGVRNLGSALYPEHQDANVYIQDRSHPATRDLPNIWVRDDEWYQYSGPLPKGYHVLATVDPAAFEDSFMLDGKDITSAQPIMWWHCEGKGRAFYSGLGHLASAYIDKTFRSSIDSAITWSLRNNGETCSK